METYFEGELVQDEELKKTARQRQKKYHEITVPKTDTDSYLKQGWEIEAEHKTTLRLRRDKAIDELLEDRVWLLFKNMSFLEMNRDRGFKIQAGPVKKQIDVFAKDQNRAFIVECKASAEEASTSREDISDICSLKDRISDSIRAKYNDRSIGISFVIVTQGICWIESHERLAREENIIIWKEAELEYFDGLVKHLGSAAKFQIYSILFPKAEIPEPIEVPAICGGKGKAKYYCFVIQPEKLLQIAYIHHRRSTPEELQGSYQRMLDGSRLRNINAFITKGGYFANNIIVNFTAKPTFKRFEKEKQVGDVICGILELPRRYASAWIIDGQHRLYGYADSPRKSEATVSVLAFEFLDVKDQARLFVEINKEQKAVSPNLLWDLYPDIYHDATDNELQHLRAISLVVRKLNSDSDSPLRDHVSIPSVPSKGRGITNLTMATLCEALQESKLLDAKDRLLYNEDYDSTVDFAVKRVKAYFDMIAQSFPQDWGKGNQGLLRTNIGIRILVIILRQVLRYLGFLGKDQVYKGQDLGRFKEEVQRLLSPALTKLAEMSDEQRSKIRKASAKGLVVNNAKQMAWWIKEEAEGFGLEILADWAPPIPEGQTDEDVKRLLEHTEISLRTFIPKRLQNLYGTNWFTRIDKEIRDYIHKGIEKEIARERWREPQLRSLPEESKMRFTTTGHLKEIVDKHWNAFEDLFMDQPYALAQLKSFVDLRNIYAHHEEQECDVVIKNLGYWATRWIRKCSGLDKDTEGKK